MESYCHQRELLQQIMQWLGPNPPTCCDGCYFDVQQVLKALTQAGIRYIPHRRDRDNQDEQNA
jgi:hypothetical protein